MINQSGTQTGAGSTAVRLSRFAPGSTTAVVVVPSGGGTYVVETSIDPQSVADADAVWTAEQAVADTTQKRFVILGPLSRVRVRNTAGNTAWQVLQGGGDRQ